MRCTGYALPGFYFDRRMTRARSLSFLFFLWRSARARVDRTTFPKQYDPNAVFFRRRIPLIVLFKRRIIGIMRLMRFLQKQLHTGHWINFQQHYTAALPRGCDPHRVRYETLTEKETVGGLCHSNLAIIRDKCRSPRSIPTRCRGLTRNDRVG